MRPHHLLIPLFLLSCAQASGGVSVSAQEWVAGIHANGSGESIPVCSGALIAPDKVITAAHCVGDGRGHVRNPDEVAVTLDGLYRDGRDARWHQVKAIAMHPDFHRGSMHQDLAVLTLAEKSPAMPLDPAGSDDLERFWRGETRAAVQAWGWGSESESGRTLGELTLETMTPDHCANHWGNLVDTQLCAVHPQGQAHVCHGDSGGPLVIEVNGRPRLAGVISYSDKDCGEGGVPAVFTSVPGHFAWTDRHVPLLALDLGGALEETEDAGLEVVIRAQLENRAPHRDAAGPVLALYLPTGATLAGEIPEYCRGGYPLYCFLEDLAPGAVIEERFRVEANPHSGAVRVELELDNAGIESGPVIEVLELSPEELARQAIGDDTIAAAGRFWVLLAFAGLLRVWLRRTRVVVLGSTR